MRGLLIASVIFVISYTQSPLGFSNQNQYLLHGLALSDTGLLNEDWLSISRDPTPIFSQLIAILNRVHLPLMISLAYAGVMVVYFVSMFVIIDCTVGRPQSRAGWLMLFALALITHAALWRWLSVQATGVDYAWYFQCGVAGQYILGAGFQPSVFGVLLVAALAAFVAKRNALFALFLIAAPLLHFTYLLPSVLIGFGALASIAKSDGRRHALRIALLLALGLAPVCLFYIIRFQPTDANTFAEAQRLLVEVRIPHHAVVAKWLDVIAILQVLGIILAIITIRKSPLAIVLATALGIAALLTLIVAITHLHLLALLFPWRVSAVLVPVATLLLAARLTRAVESYLHKVGECLAIVVITASLIFGCWHLVQPIGYHMNEASEQGLLDFISENKKTGDIYLIPIRIPQLSGGRKGSISTTFTSPPRPTSKNLIPVDLQRFRLRTTAPLYIDFKAIPYADHEVLEWYRRARLAESWYQRDDWQTALPELRSEGITHIVTPADRPIANPETELLYQDEWFRLYRLKS